LQEKPKGKIMDEYKKLIKKIADFHLQQFLYDGYAKAGCNGPYGDCDTPMRNTAHWCIIYSFLYSKYKNENYLDVIKKFIEYLMSEDYYGISGAAICRTKHTDDTNGVIGQAWIIEGLIEAFKILQNEQLLERAISIFNSQKFIDEVGLWKICCSNGKVVGYDYVFNHNLWLAASGCLILEQRESPDIRKKVTSFLEHSKNTYAVQPSGCLYHLINLDASKWGKIKYRMKQYLTDFNIGKFKKMNYLEKGYHLFDLYGFAIIKKQFADHPQLNSKRIYKAIEYGCNEKVLAKLGNLDGKFNKYSYPYNSPAFEYPFVSERLGGGCNEKIAMKMLDIQFKHFFDEKTMMFSHNNKDPDTLAARIYELVRYFQEREIIA